MSISQSRFVSRGVWKHKKSYVKLSNKAKSNNRLTLRRKNCNTLEW